MILRRLIAFLFLTTLASAQGGSAEVLRALRGGRIEEAGTLVERALPRLAEGRERERYLGAVALAFRDAGASARLLRAIPESRDPMLLWYRGNLALELRRLRQAAREFDACEEILRERGDPNNRGLWAQRFELARRRFDDEAAAEAAAKLGSEWDAARAWHLRRISTRDEARLRQMIALALAVVAAGIALFFGVKARS